MSIAPEPYHAALMSVVEKAMLYLREDAREKRIEPAQVVTLMDALHNIPYYIGHWDECDEHYLKNSFVAYDMRWADKGLRLLDTYTAALNGSAARD